MATIMIEVTIIDSDGNPEMTLGELREVVRGHGARARCRAVRKTTVIDTTAVLLEPEVAS